MLVRSPGNTCVAAAEVPANAHDIMTACTALNRSQQSHRASTRHGEHRPASAQSPHTPQLYAPNGLLARNTRIAAHGFTSRANAAYLGSICTCCSRRAQCARPQFTLLVAPPGAGLGALEAAGSWQQDGWPRSWWRYVFVTRANLMRIAVGWARSRLTATLDVELLALAGSAAQCTVYRTYSGNREDAQRGTL